MSSSDPVHHTPEPPPVCPATSLTPSPVSHTLSLPSSSLIHPHGPGKYPILQKSKLRPNKFQLVDLPKFMYLYRGRAMVWAQVSGSKPHPLHTPTLFLSVLQPESCLLETTWWFGRVRGPRTEPSGFSPFSPAVCATNSVSSLPGSQASATTPGLFWCWE